MNTILVDDDRLSLKQLKQECMGISDIDVVGEFQNAQEALSYAKKNPVDFALLDIEMPEMNGLDLGKRLKEINKEMVMIYVTGYTQYVVDTLKMKADYCIMKPYDRQDIMDAVERAALLSKRLTRRVQVRIFGRFEVFVNDKLLDFRNKKAKELLALCMDHAGGSVGMEEAIDKLWPDRAYDEKVKRLYRKAVISIQNVLGEANAPKFFVSKRGECHVLPQKLIVIILII